MLQWNNDNFYSAVTITLGELVEAGVIDWSDPSWHWNAYNDEQYTRMCEKINNRFWLRDIGTIPPGQWKREFMRKMNELMPKYKLLYEATERGFDFMADSGDYGKSREIYSDFPQTMLSGNSDYATNGRDREFENVHTGATIDKIQKFVNDYKDVDALLLDELECLFSCLYTVSLNGM